MKTEFSRNFTALFSGTTISQIIPFILAPIISRLYSPADFGFYSFFISIVGLLSIIVTLKYEMAIILPSNTKIADQLLQTSILLSVFASSLILAITILGYFIFHYELIFLTLPFAVFLLSMVNIYDRFYNRAKQYKKMSYQRIAKSSMESGYNLLGYIKTFKSYNLIYGFILSYLVSFLFVWINEYKTIKKVFSKISSLRIRLTLIRYIDFPKYNLPHTFLNTLSTSIPILLIPIYYDQSVLGSYTFGLKYIQAPLALISAAIYNVIGQEFSENLNNREALSLKFYYVLKKLILFSILLFPCLIFAESIFSLVFGNQWAVSGEFICILSLWIILNFIVSSFANIPIIFNQQKTALIIEIIYSLIKILPFAIGAGFLGLAITHVLLIYMIMSSLLLILVLIWYRTLLTH
jgi:O-antigen/teichoic acid export membrane protein